MNNTIPRFFIRRRIRKAKRVVDKRKAAGRKYIRGQIGHVCDDPCKQCPSEPRKQICRLVQSMKASRINDEGIVCMLQNLFRPQEGDAHAKR